MKKPLRVMIALLLLGCGRGEDIAFESADEMAGSTAREAEPVEPALTTVQVVDSLASSMIIRSGRARVEVESLESGVQAVRAIGQRVGGYTTNVTLRSGREQPREAMIELRVPAARFDSAIAGLSSIGKVGTVTVTAEDVGEEYVDLRARVDNERRLEQRLLSLLANQTGDLEDVLAVERELARVRGTIDRQEGRLRYLRNRVAMSTLAVTVHEPAALLASYGAENVITAAFRSAARNFVLVIAGMITALGVVIPLAGAGALVWVAVRRLGGGQRA